MPPEFWQTGMGHKLIQSDVPTLIKALERIATALEELKPAAPAQPPDEPRRVSPMMTTIRFTPQAWVNDYAIECDPQGPLTFDVPSAEVPDDDADPGEWDLLREHPNAPRWIREWSGPFECDKDQP